MAQLFPEEWEVPENLYRESFTSRIDRIAIAICGADTDSLDGINPWHELSDRAQSRYRRMAAVAMDELGIEPARALNPPERRVIGKERTP